MRRKGGRNARADSGVGRVHQALQEVPAQPAHVPARSAAASGSEENVFARSRSLFCSDFTCWPSSRCWPKGVQCGCSWLSRVHIKAPTMSYETSRLVSTQSRCLELVLLKHQYNHDHAIQASKFFLKFYIMVNLKANVVEQYWNFDKFLNFGSIQCSFKYLKKVLGTTEDSTNLISFKCQWWAIKTGWKVSTLIDILILKQFFCWCKDSIP